MHGGDSFLIPSNPLEEINVGEFLHLVHISFGFDHLLVIEKNPGFFMPIDRDIFANECDVMPTRLSI